MARSKTAGLTQRGGVWWIRKSIKGYGRLQESCGTDDEEEAKRYLNRRLEQIREAMVYGVRPDRTFADAAAKFLEENTHLRSLVRFRYAFDAVTPYIGDLSLRQIHMGTLEPLIKARLKVVKVGTVNKELGAIRSVLNKAERLWRDEHGLSWLDRAPLIKLLEDDSEREAYILSLDEQRLLLKELPSHKAEQCLFAVNTGTRSREVCRLRWDWLSSERPVFVIPAKYHKNKKDRVVVLNSIAQRVVDAQRGKHDEYVFTYRGEPVEEIGSKAFRKARVRAGLPLVRPHDMKHTFGYRLRQAGVGFEDRQDLLGHKRSKITAHYCAADIDRLIEAAEKVTDLKVQTGYRPVLLSGTSVGK